MTYNCIICGKFQMQITTGQKLNVVCDKYLKLWEKAESRQAKRLADARKELRRMEQPPDSTKNVVERIT